MRALVTGATGFVGSHLVEALSARGDEITLLARSATRAASLDTPFARVVLGSLDEERPLATAVEGQQVVYHVAGLVRARNEAEFLHANRDGTRNLLHAAVRAGQPRFVFVSSLAATGPTRRGRPLRGDEPPRPLNAYGRSKLGGENEVHESGLPWTIVRPPMVYGPRDTEFLRLFRAARRGVAPLFGDGGQELSSIYAPDLAQALIAAAAPAAIERTYYAAHERIVTSAEFVRAVGRAVGRDVRTVRLGRGMTRCLLHAAALAARLTGRRTVLRPEKLDELYAAAWTADPAALHRDTGWKAGHDIDAGLAATAAWYRAEGWL